MCCAVFAEGTLILLLNFFIRPEKRVTAATTKGASTGSVALAYPASGCMAKENFAIYTYLFIKHFIRYSRVSKKKKCLIFLDNHENHITPATIDMSRDNDITPVTVPPHTTHRMQLLDKSIFGPFKTFYDQAADD